MFSSKRNPRSIRYSCVFLENYAKPSAQEKELMLSEIEISWGRWFCVFVGEIRKIAMRVMAGNKANQSLSVQLYCHEQPPVPRKQSWKLENKVRNSLVQYPTLFSSLFLRDSPQYPTLFSCLICCAEVSGWFYWSASFQLYFPKTAVVVSGK